MPYNMRGYLVDIITVILLWPVLSDCAMNYVTTVSSIIQVGFVLSSVPQTSKVKWSIVSTTLLCGGGDMCERDGGPCAPLLTHLQPGALKIVKKYQKKFVPYSMIRITPIRVEHMWPALSKVGGSRVRGIWEIDQQKSASLKNGE